MEQGNEMDVVMRKLFWAIEEIHKLREDMDEVKEKLEKEMKYTDSLGERIAKNFRVYEAMENDVGDMQELVNEDKDKAYREIMNYLFNASKGLNKLGEQYYNIINNI